jgi:hypothetical protein
VRFCAGRLLPFRRRAVAAAFSLLTAAAMTTGIPAAAVEADVFFAGWS